MGAQSFQHDRQVGGETLAEAFAAAVEDAKYSYGHEGYTGSLAEKYDVVQIVHTPMGYTAATTYAQELLGEGDERIDDKWGPAGAIPLTAEDDAGETQTFTVTVTKPVFRGGSIEPSQTVPLLPAAATRGKRILSVSVVSTTDLVYGAPKVTRGEGAIVTRYTVSGLPGMWDSIAAARKAAVDAAKNGVLRPIPADIRAVVTRGTSEALLTVEPVVKKATVTVKVVTAPAAAPAGRLAAAHNARPEGGWLFFGWASS